jgi:hypothetical protein
MRKRPEARPGERRLCKIGAESAAERKEPGNISRRKTNVVVNQKVKVIVIEDGWNLVY